MEHVEGATRLSAWMQRRYARGDGTGVELICSSRTFYASTRERGAVVMGTGASLLEAMSELERRVSVLERVTYGSQEGA